MLCPHCNGRLVHKSTGETRVRIKGKVLLKSDGAHTQCFWCGKNVVVPLRLVEPPIKPGTKLILRKPGKKAEGVDKEDRIS